MAPLLEQIDSGIGSATADGAYDGAPTYDTVAARAGEIPMIILPHVTAVLSAAAGHHPSQRDQHIILMAAKKRLGWQKETGYGRRSLVETTMGRYNDHRTEFACAQPAWPVRRSSRRRGGSQPHAARRTAKLRS